MNCKRYKLCIWLMLFLFCSSCSLIYLRNQVNLKRPIEIYETYEDKKDFSFHYFFIQDNKFIILIFSLKVIKFTREYNFPKNVEKIKDMWNIIKYFFYNKIHEFLFSYILTFHVFAIKIYGNKNFDSAIY